LDFSFYGNLLKHLNGERRAKSFLKSIARTQRDNIKFTACVKNAFNKLMIVRLDYLFFAGKSEKSENDILRIQKVN
jgi:hypothetical protein